MQDIHTHLYWHTYDADRDAVVERARAAGVKEMFVIGCTVEESKQAVELTEKYTDVYASVGIHPSFFNELVEKEFQSPSFQFQSKLETLKQAVKELAQNKKVIAIGECGLEYYSHNQQSTISNQQKEAQKAGFLAQIELAKELKLPLIVHCRASTGSTDAYEDMLQMLQTAYYKLPTILHCYMGDTEVTKQFLTLPNISFSFTGNITYPIKKVAVGTKDDLTETVQLIPLDRIFTETDCPFLTPQSKRGERNEPAYVREVVTKIAELQGRSMVEVERAIEKNFQKIFPND